MCGIAGILDRNGRPIDRAMLGRMGRVIAHRGPDGEGSFIDHGTPSVGLTNRRLAIIDVDHGQQPMTTPEGRFTIVYNGELFNAAELRGDLKSHGTRFRTHSDTEVFLHGYAAWGRLVLDRLNGMWAAAIWDHHERSLLVARDRLGVKPLVYAEVPGGLVFASEIKSLLTSGLVGRELNAAAIPYYLTSFVVPEPYSFFRGVERLPAGHYLLADATGTRVVRYWDCNEGDEEDRGLPAYEEEVGELVCDGARRQLVSDVPLGVFLSGGIDSALLAALAARESAGPLRTFTLGFEGSGNDERPAARALANQLGAKHTEEVVSARAAATVLPDLLEAHDEPGQSLLQNHFVSQLARRDVKVALAGIGGDELFSAYPTHRVVDLLARLDRLPPWARGAAMRFARVAGGARGRRLSALLRLPPDARVTQRLFHLTDAGWRTSIVDPSLATAIDFDSPARHLESHYARSKAKDPLNRLLYVYVKTYLVDELLRAADSMSMHNSLEVRVPLLDHRLVEHALRIPSRHKMSLFDNKIILRRVAKELIPAGSLARKKRGFAAPIDVWLRKELTEALRDVLSEAAVKHRGVFSPVGVSQVLHRYLDGEHQLVQPVMMLFAFEQWARRRLDAPPPAVREDIPSVESAVVEVSVIIVNWNTREILQNCLTSVAQHLSSVSHEVIVVDNASVDGSSEMVARDFPGVRLIRNSENAGFARANNQAMRVARGEWFMLLNSDTLLFDDSVSRLFARVRTDATIGVAHVRLLHEDGRLQHSTYRFPSLWLAILEDLGLYKFLAIARRGDLLLSSYWDQAEERDVDWVSGAFMLVPRVVFERTGGFSEAYFMYGEDMEWAWRIREAGWHIRYFPQASITHLDHKSSAVRWGDRRIAICIARQLDIYERRYGFLWGACFNAVKIFGAALRVVYFSIRGIPRDANREYYLAMRRYSWLSLKTHARLLLRRDDQRLSR